MFFQARHIFFLLLLTIFQLTILKDNRTYALPRYSSTITGTVNITAELIISNKFSNSAGNSILHTRESSFATADSCPYLEKWFTTDGQILDFNDNKVLVVDKTSFENPRIIDATNGMTLPIPFNYPIHTGFLTPQGVVFTGTFSSGDSLFDYNNGHIYTLAFNPRSVKVNGSYCIWAIRDVKSHPMEYIYYDSLFIRDLSALTNKLVYFPVSEMVDFVETQHNVSESGDVAFINASQNLIKYANSIYTIITSNGTPMSPIGSANPLTDGYNIVYQKIRERDVSVAVAGQQNMVLTDIYHQYRPSPTINYQANNKYIAYINVPNVYPFKSEVHVLNPSGNNILVKSGSTFYDFYLELLNLNGELMFMEAGHNRKLAKLNGTIIPICYSGGSIAYNDTSWYIVEASQILKIGLFITPDMLDNSSIYTAKDSSYKFKPTDFTDQFNGPGQLISIAFSRLPVNGTLMKEGSPVVINQIISSADLSKISYQPGGGFTGNDSIQWKISDGYNFTSNPALLLMQVVKLPDTPQLTGLADSYCSNEGLQKIKIANYPDYSDLIDVDVRLDTVRMEINSPDSSFTFNPANFSTGMHLMKTTFTNAVGASIDTQHFYIQQPVIPVVKVSADITNVINLAKPVTLASANTAGGGTSPLFTFAKDALFVNILQAQSSNNKLIIDPNSLAIGNNWIYARMRTSENCYSQQIAIDSINITRDAITGITDPDNPGIYIVVNPNPFDNQIYIRGLNTAKKYTLTLYPASGQTIFSKTVYNSSSISIADSRLVSGIYFLGIFDASKGKLLGTVKLIKN